MKYVLAGLGTTIVVIVAAVNIENLLNSFGSGFMAGSICCGLIAGLGWKILDEIRALKARLPKREDAK